MVEDRYANNRLAYITVMITIISAVLLLGYILFLIPYLFLHLEYDIPRFHFEFIEYIQYKYEVAHEMAHFVVLGGLLFIALLLVVISIILSRRIEKNIILLLPENEKTSFNERYPGLILSSKLIGIIIIFLIIGVFFRII